jgi:hypothetical protein
MKCEFYDILFIKIKKITPILIKTSEILKAAYKRLYNHDLDKDMANEEGGPLGRIFRFIINLFKFN